MKKIFLIFAFWGACSSLNDDAERLSIAKVQKKIKNGRNNMIFIHSSTKNIFFHKYISVV